MTGAELAAIQDHLAAICRSTPELGGPNAAYDRAMQLPHDTLVALVMVNALKRSHELYA